MKRELDLIDTFCELRTQKNWLIIWVYLTTHFSIHNSIILNHYVLIGTMYFYNARARQKWFQYGLSLKKCHIQTKIWSQISLYLQPNLLWQLEPELVLYGTRNWLSGQADLAIYSCLSMKWKVISAAVILINKMDFSCCPDKAGLPTPSQIYASICIHTYHIVKHFGGKKILQIRKVFWQKNFCWIKVN